jgi:hypothetical protein
MWLLILWLLGAWILSDTFPPAISHGWAAVPYSIVVLLIPLTIYRDFRSHSRWRISVCSGLVALFVWAMVFTITQAVLETEGTWNVHPEYQHALWGLDAGRAIPILSWWIGLLTAVLSWVACSPRHPRLRFEIPFWGGLALIAVACRCSWHASAAMSHGEEGTPFGQAGLIQSVPLLCVFTAFMGLFLILVAIHRNGRG